MSRSRPSDFAIETGKTRPFKREGHTTTIYGHRREPLKMQKKQCLACFKRKRTRD